MEENEYRSLYRETVPLRCVFEKSILARQCNCSRARRHNLAEREAVACGGRLERDRCETWLALLRQKAMFALHLREVDGPLSHAKEMKIQVGGLRGLVQAADNAGSLEDIHGLLEAACGQYGSLGALPFTEIMPAIAHYQGRPRRGPGS